MLHRFFVQAFRGIEVEGVVVFEIIEAATTEVGSASMVLFPLGDKPFQRFTPVVLVAFMLRVDPHLTCYRSRPPKESRVSQS